VAAAQDRQFRPVWIVALGWIACNLLLHSYWQFRDAIFLYAAHSHIGFFVLVLAGARWAQDRQSSGNMPNGMLAYGGAAALVTVLAAINNLPLYLALPVMK
jgi:hypothetical protein